MLNKATLVKVGTGIGKTVGFVLIYEIVLVGLMHADNAICKVIKKKKSSTANEEA